MDTFNLRIIDNTAIYFNGKAVSCQLTTLVGDIGFLANHENFLATLAPGSQITYSTADGTINEIEAACGVLMFQNNSCTITLEKEDAQDKK